MKIMRLTILLAVSLILLYCGGWNVRPSSGRTDGNPNVIPITEIASKNVENIVTIVSDRSTPSQIDKSIGTGFFLTINNETYVVTNLHVIENSTAIEIQKIEERNNEKKKKYYKDVEVVLASERFDIAVLKIDTFEQLPRGVELNLNRKLKNGEKIVVIGNPTIGSKTLSQTITDGVISQARQTLNDNTNIEYIQISAPVNPGNSGGPLFDVEGKVIGIVTLKAMNTESISFALNIDYVYDLILELQNDKLNQITPEEQIKTRVNGFLAALQFQNYEEASYFFAPAVLRLVYNKISSAYKNQSKLVSSIEKEFANYTSSGYKDEEALKKVIEKFGSEVVFMYILITSKVPYDSINIQRKYLNFVLKLTYEKININGYEVKEIWIDKNNSKSAQVGVSININGVPQSAKISMVYDWGKWYVMDIIFSNIRQQADLK